MVDFSELLRDSPQCIPYVLYFLFTLTSECVRARNERARRFCTPSFRIILATWAFTVRSPMPRGDPISLLERPTTSNSRTSFSRSVKLTRPAGEGRDRAGPTPSNKIHKTHRRVPTATQLTDPATFTQFARLEPSTSY